MNTKQTEELIFKVVSEQFNVPLQDITPGLLLIEDLGADSPALVEFSARLEDAFEIELPDLRFLADKDLGALTQFIATCH